MRHSWLLKDEKLSEETKIDLIEKHLNAVVVSQPSWEERNLYTVTQTKSLPAAEHLKLIREANALLKAKSLREDKQAEQSKKDSEVSDGFLKDYQDISIKFSQRQHMFKQQGQTNEVLEMCDALKAAFTACDDRADYYRPLVQAPKRIVKGSYLILHEESR